MTGKCDNCDNPATIHLTEIVDGQKTEKHLCEKCAMSEGITITANIPISKLLENFVLQAPDDLPVPELKCDVCGLSYAEFRQKAVLGCPNDYDAFASALVPLIERTQEGAQQHIGKVPLRAGSDQKKQNALLRLRAELKGAVRDEDYERAAELRDQIKKLEAP